MATTTPTNLGGEYKHVLAEKTGAVLALWMNRPEASNAMNDRMEEELLDALDLADNDGDIKVVTLRGKGAVFSAGHDLKEGAARRASGGPSRQGKTTALFRHNLDPLGERAWYCRKTLIAGVHGYVGPAAQFMLDAFDFVLATEDTRFSREQARMGSSAAGGYITPFLLPMRVINHLQLIGGWMDAKTAKDLHYVQRVVPNVDELANEIDKWADAASALSVAQIAAHKESIHRRYEIMGLTGIIGIGNHQVGTGEAANNPDTIEYQRILREHGMREALRFRAGKTDPTVAKV